jgi:hypothetical protein
VRGAKSFASTDIRVQDLIDGLLGSFVDHSLDGAGSVGRGCEGGGSIRRRRRAGLDGRGGFPHVFLGQIEAKAIAIAGVDSLLCVLHCGCALPDGKEGCVLQRAHSSFEGSQKSWFSEM